jgi:hypothetical protein
MIYKNKKLNLKNDASYTIKMFQFHAKYKNKSFEEISELVRNDKKIMQTLIRSLNHPSTSQDKKNEIENKDFPVKSLKEKP